MAYQGNFYILLNLHLQRCINVVERNQVICKIESIILLKQLDLNDMVKIGAFKIHNLIQLDFKWTLIHHFLNSCNSDRDQICKKFQPPLWIC